VVDANGRLLRAFTTDDGKWRLKTTMADVDPVYLALLKDYEDHRFDVHWGCRSLRRGARPRPLWIRARGHIVSGASTLSMQGRAPCSSPGRARLPNKIIEAAARPAARMALFQTRGAGHLPDAGADGRQPRGGCARPSFAYFGKGAAPAQRRRGSPAGPPSRNRRPRRRPDRAPPPPLRRGRDGVLQRGLEHGVIDQALFSSAISRPGAGLVGWGMPMNATASLGVGSPVNRPPPSCRRRCASSCRAHSASWSPTSARSCPTRAQIALVAIDNRTGGVVAWLGGGEFLRPRRAKWTSCARIVRQDRPLKPMIYALAFRRPHLAPRFPGRRRAGTLQGLAAAQLRPRTIRAPSPCARRAAAVAERGRRCWRWRRSARSAFIATLRSAGAAPGLPPGDNGASLGIALGSATISPLEMAGLYSGLANGGQFRVAHDSAVTSRARRRCAWSGPAAAWYVSEILADAPLPEGFASLPVALRERRIAYKTGTSAGFRDALGRRLLGQLDDRGCGVGHADGTSRPGQLGPPCRAPRLVQGVRPPAGRGQSRAGGRRPTHCASPPNRDLPLRMRTLGPTAMAEGGPAHRLSAA